MKYKNRSTFLLSLTLSLSLLAPSTALAVLPIGFPTSPTDTIPPIPISDSAVRNKEVGITIFGVTIPGVTYDGLAIRVAKAAIERIVDSTVDWINGGFDGSPAYVSNPGQYLTSIADQVAGQFIEESPALNGLCSPIQTNVRLSLQTYYLNTYRGGSYSSSQCTLSQIVDNIDDFYTDFSKGGWRGWFSLTQGYGNNPYLAYMQAQSELDSRIATALKLEEDDLNRGRGFISLKDSEGNIKTPGSVIEGQLQNVLGTGIRQLELADEFDELIEALIGQLLQRTVFSSSGLSGARPSSGGGNTGGGGGGGGGTPGQPTNPMPEPLAACMVVRDFASPGSPVTWLAQTSLSGASYLWQGEELDGRTEQSVSVTYSAAGVKTGSITVNGTENSQPRSVTVDCVNSVTIIDLGSGIIPL